MHHSFPLTGIQQARLDRFKCAASVDVHCHILPETDDGPASREDCIALARALVRDGITHVIATPHQLGRYEGMNRAADVRARVIETSRALEALKIPLELLSGGEVRIDPAIPKHLEQDAILTLADGRKHLLLELPSQVPMGAEAIMQHLSQTHLKIVLAHAERYEMHRKDPASVQAWIDAGAILQVNAGSLSGANGEKMQKMVFDWIGRGWVSVISSDAHSTGTRRPRMTDAINTLCAMFDESVARTICIENPHRILNGEDLPPLQPAEPKPT